MTRSSTEDQRAEQLYDEGAKLLASRWDEAVGLVRYSSHGRESHSPRESLGYADVLLRAGDAGSVAQAERIISIIETMQETRADDPHRGNFRWFFEDQVVTDLNAVEFLLDALNEIVRDHGDHLSPAGVARIRRMIALGLDEIARLDVHLEYTNIALSDICNSVLGGELLDDQRSIERGRRRLEEWIARTEDNGAPHEYNSATYAAVDIARMASLAERANDVEIRERARKAEELLWLHVARHYHPGLAQITGPHSRSYRDGWTGAGGYMKLILWRLLGDDRLRGGNRFFPGGREEGHTGIARGMYHVPEQATSLLREKRYPFDVGETVHAGRGLDITTHMTESYALGTASRSYAVGDPPEAWRADNGLLLHFARGDSDPSVGTLFCRYVIDDADSAVFAGEAAADFIDQGQFVAAQHRNRAIIAYGLLPRLRPTRSARLAVRMLGVGDRAEIWSGERRIDNFSCAVQGGAPIVIGEGSVYVAITPLAPSRMGASAPIELDVRGGMLLLDLYNYRGPAKQFWEHRSQSGPFYQANIRSAIIIEVAERGEYESVEAFARHVTSAKITDEIDASHEREITYTSGDASISMKYSLWDMNLLERRFDGVVYRPPVGRAT